MTTTTNKNNRVVIAYDMNLENFQMATAIRGVLEFYGLQVTLVWLNEKQNAIDFLAGYALKADYTILCAHGIGKENRIWFTVVEKVIGTVDPTNNVAERVIRPTVIWRRTSFGSNSAAGSEFVSRLLTVVSSLILQERNILEFLSESVAAKRSGQVFPSLIP